MWDKATGIINMQASKACIEARLKLRRMMKLIKPKYYCNMINKLDYYTIFNSVGQICSQWQYSTTPIKQANGGLATSNLAKQQTLS